uniref:Uncharacterized protein n=1 Tax=Opuntia streptacantha TaxID=393608 RepID=A0A7C9E763_OPUST
MNHFRPTFFMCSYILVDFTVVYLSSTFLLVLLTIRICISKLLLVICNFLRNFFSGFFGDALSFFVDLEFLCFLCHQGTLISILLFAHRFLILQLVVNLDDTQALISILIFLDHMFSRSVGFIGYYAITTGSCGFCGTLELLSIFSWFGTLVYGDTFHYVA